MLGQNFNSLSFRIQLIQVKLFAFYVLKSNTIHIISFILISMVIPPKIEIEES